MAILHTDVGSGPTRSTTTLDPVGNTLHLVPVTASQMWALQRVGTHHVPFLHHPEWHNESVLENHMQNAATQSGHPQPTDGEVREAYGLFCSPHKQTLPREPSQRLTARTSGVCTGHHGPSSTPPGTQQTQNHIATSQGARQLVDATAAQGTQLLSAATATVRADKHPHHLLEMWAPSAGQPMAPPPTAGTLSPHTRGPCHPGTKPVATYTIRTGFGGGHGHSRLGTQHHCGMEIPAGSVGHQTPSNYLLGAGQTPQYHAGGPRLPG